MGLEQVYGNHFSSHLLHGTYGVKRFDYLNCAPAYTSRDKALSQTIIQTYKSKKAHLSIAIHIAHIRRFMGIQHKEYNLFLRLQDIHQVYGSPTVHQHHILYLLVVLLVSLLQLRNTPHRDQCIRNIITFKQTLQYFTRTYRVYVVVNQ